MKETIVKINKTKAGSLRRETKFTSLWADSSRKKKERIKSTKSEIRKEKLQQTMQKYKGL